ncbi:uncharacterized protein [Phaenicophaeus curvirostris]|uniref:uncharacterized protein n=1 Tax=Phaenicophaeus curvirostris TaxID=33595 RepID=UPI0037F0C790
MGGPGFPSVFWRHAQFLRSLMFFSPPGSLGLHVPLASIFSSSPRSLGLQILFSSRFPLSRFSRPPGSPPLQVPLASRFSSSPGSFGLQVPLASRFSSSPCSLPLQILLLSRCPWPPGSPPLQVLLAPRFSTSPGSLGLHVLFLSMFPWPSGSLLLQVLISWPSRGALSHPMFGYHRIMDGLGWKGPQTHPVPPLPRAGTPPTGSGAPSSIQPALNPSREGAATTSPGTVSSGSFPGAPFPTGSCSEVSMEPSLLQDEQPQLSSLSYRRFSSPPIISMASSGLAPAAPCPPCAEGSRAGHGTPGWVSPERSRGDNPLPHPLLPPVWTQPRTRLVSGLEAHGVGSR